MAAQSMVPAVIAVGIGCLTIGYWVGQGQSLLSYNKRSHEILEREEGDDESEFDSEEEMAAIRDQGSSFDGAEECKMILAVRMDIKMEKGKIAAQCGHATLAAYKTALKQTPKYVKQWERLGQAKVAVKCPDEDTLLQLETKARQMGIPAKCIIDAGRTQIAPNTRTVLGIGPAPISAINQITGHLKLL